MSPELVFTVIIGVQVLTFLGLTLRAEPLRTLTLWELRESPAALPLCVDPPPRT